MRLSTIRTPAGTRAVRIDGDTAIETGHSDVGALLSDVDWRRVAESAYGAGHDAHDLDVAPVVPRPGKIVCVGINYAAHLTEMGREQPDHPTLFAKYPEALVGAPR